MFCFCFLSCVLFLTSEPEMNYKMFQLPYTQRTKTCRVSLKTTLVYLIIGKPHLSICCMFPCGAIAHANFYVLYVCDVDKLNK